MFNVVIAVMFSQIALAAAWGDRCTRNHGLGALAVTGDDWDTSPLSAPLAFSNDDNATLVGHVGWRAAVYLSDGKVVDERKYAGRWGGNGELLFDEKGEQGWKECGKELRFKGRGWFFQCHTSVGGFIVS